MKKYHYKVEYLKANIRSSEIANGTAGMKVAEQIEEKINEQMSRGYELHQQLNTLMEIKPGCMGGLMGSKTDFITISTTVFRKEIES